MAVAPLLGADALEVIGRILGLSRLAIDRPEISEVDTTPDMRPEAMLCATPSCSGHIGSDLLNFILCVIFNTKPLIFDYSYCNNRKFFI